MHQRLSQKSKMSSDRKAIKSAAQRLKKASSEENGRLNCKNLLNFIVRQCFRPTARALQEGSGTPFHRALRPRIEVFIHLSLVLGRGIRFCYVFCSILRLTGKRCAPFCSKYCPRLSWQACLYGAGASSAVGLAWESGGCGLLGLDAMHLPTPGAARISRKLAVRDGQGEGAWRGAIRPRGNPSGTALPAVRRR